VGGEKRRAKSLRIGVHHANAVVWGPVYRTRLELFAERRLAVAAAAAAAVAVVAVVAVVVCGEADLVYALVVRCRSHQIIKTVKYRALRPRSSRARRDERRRARERKRKRKRSKKTVSPASGHCALGVANHGGNAATTSLDRKNL
jgi:hypothetical protein